MDSRADERFMLGDGDLDGKTARCLGVFMVLLRWCIKSLVALVVFVVVYGLCIVGVPYIGVGQATMPTDENITIYLWSNGVHTDFVLPTHSPQQNWTDIFLPHHVKDGQARAWTAIGWGDKGFYLNTPTWAELKVSTALKAISGTSQSAMHVTFYDDKEVASCQRCAKVSISPAQYQQLITYIKKDITWQNHQAMPIDTTAQYGDTDAFYEAKGSYFLFYTCNTWVNEGLKAMGVPSAWWTITDKGILQHYP